MKKRYNITINPDIHKKGVRLAKSESKKQDKYISFSRYVENLILESEVKYHSHEWADKYYLEDEKIESESKQNKS